MINLLVEYLGSLLHKYIDSIDDNYFHFNYSPIWAYECEIESNKCVKVKYNVDAEQNMGFAWCRQTCMNRNEINVWPSVQQLHIAESSRHIKIKSINFRENNSKNLSNPFWEDNIDRFHKQLDNKIPKLSEVSAGQLDVYIDIMVNSEDTNLTMETNESYTLQAFEENGSVRITVSSETIFGARYALESLVQLIFYDDFSNTLVVSLTLTHLYRSAQMERS